MSQEVESWKAHIRKKSGDNILDDEVLAARPPSPIKSVTCTCLGWICIIKWTYIYTCRTGILVVLVCVQYMYHWCIYYCFVYIQCMVMLSLCFLCRDSESGSAPPEEVNPVSCV